MTNCSIFQIYFCSNTLEVFEQISLKAYAAPKLKTWSAPRGEMFIWEDALSRPAVQEIQEFSNY